MNGFDFFFVHFSSDIQETNYYMLTQTLSKICLAVCLTLFSSQLFSQDSLFQLVDGDTIIYHGIISADGNGVLLFKAKSDRATNLIISFTPFIDEATGDVFSPTIASSSTIYMPANEPTDVYINLTGLSKAGEFTGTLTASLSTTPGGRKGKIPVKFRLLDTSDVKVGLPSTAPYRPTKGMFGNTWLSDAILPVDFNHEKLSFSIDNTSDYGIKVTNIELDVNGNASHEIPAGLISWENSAVGVGAKGDEGINIDFNTKNVKPDRYTGNLRVEIEGYEDPFIQPISIDVKRGVGGAIIALLIGLFLSLLVKMLNSNKDKTAAYEKLEKIWEIVVAKKEEVKYRPTYNNLRDRILYMETADEVTKINEALETFRTEVLGEEAVVQEASGGEVTRSDAPPKPDISDTTQPRKRVIPESLRIRFLVHFAKPVLWIFLVFVTLLIGINDIYIQGGDTFGAGGLWDYLRLIVWGAASEIFSSGITDTQMKSLKSALDKK